jgi:hypothetical protein
MSRPVDPSSASQNDHTRDHDSHSGRVTRPVTCPCSVPPTRRGLRRNSTSAVNS